MQRIYDLIKDPAFWFAAGFLALVVNVLSSYLRDWIDRTRAKFSEERREKLYKQVAARNSRIMQWATDSEKLAEGKQAEIRMRLRALQLLGVSGWLGVMSLIVQPPVMVLVVLSSLLFLGVSTSLYNTANRLATDISDAQFERQVQKGPKCSG